MPDASPTCEHSGLFCVVRPCTQTRQTTLTKDRPGFREHMVFNHDKYCNNAWAWSFVTSYHFLWPFEIRDAYHRKAETSFYRLSTSFLEAANDLRSYTLDSSFINVNPEFLGDVPQYNSICPQLGEFQENSVREISEARRSSNGAHSQVSPGPGEYSIT